MAKVAYQHVDPDGSFGFHRVDGSLVEVSGDKPYETTDVKEIAYLDSVSCVKRAAKAAGGKEA